MAFKDPRPVCLIDRIVEYLLEARFIPCNLLIRDQYLIICRRQEYLYPTFQTGRRAINIKEEI